MMQTNLVRTALELEERMRRSPLHKMNILYSLRSTGPSRVNFLFANKADLEEAVRLELAFGAGVLAEGHFKLRFPNVPYLAITANYNVKGFDANGNVLSSEGVAVLMPGHEDKLDGVRIELCFGSGYMETDGSKQYVGDLVVGMSVSPEGRVAESWKGLLYGHTKFDTSHLGLNRRMNVAQAFDVLERYVQSNSPTLEPVKAAEAHIPA